MSASTPPIHGPAQTQVKAITLIPLSAGVLIILLPASIADSAEMNP
jgi:hypothetical protein